MKNLTNKISLKKKPPQVCEKSHFIACRWNIYRASIPRWPSIVSHGGKTVEAPQNASLIDADVIMADHHGRYQQNAAWLSWCWMAWDVLAGKIELSAYEAHIVASSAKIEAFLSPNRGKISWIQVGPSSRGLHENLTCDTGRKLR